MCAKEEKSLDVEVEFWWEHSSFFIVDGGGMCGPQSVAAVRGILLSIAATGVSATMVEVDELLTGGGMAGAGDGE